MSVVVKIPNKVKHEEEFNSLKSHLVDLQSISDELLLEKTNLDKEIPQSKVINTVDDAVRVISMMERINKFNEFNMNLIDDNKSNIQSLTELRDNIKREIQEAKATEAALAAAAAQKEADAAATLQQQQQAQENAALELQHAQTQIQDLINTLKDQRTDITTNTLGDNDFTQFDEMNRGLDGFLLQEGISQPTKDAITGLKDEMTRDLDQRRKEDTDIRREFETAKIAEIYTISEKIAGLDAASKETDISKLTPILASSNPPSILGDIRERMDNLRKSNQEKQADYKTKIANIRAMVETDKYDFRSIAELNEELDKLEDRRGTIQYVTQPMGKISSKSIDIEKSPIQLVVELELDKASNASNHIILGSILQRAKADVAYFDEKLQNIERKRDLLHSDKHGEFKDRIRGLKSKQEEYIKQYKIQEERLNQMKPAIAPHPLPVSEEEIDVSVISPPTTPRPNARRVISSKPLNEPPFTPTPTPTPTPTTKELATISPPSPRRDAQLYSPRRALPRLTESQGSASGAGLAAPYELEPAENPPTGGILPVSKPTASNTSRTGFFIPRTDSKDDPIYMVDILDEQGGDIPDLISDNVTIRQLNLENIEDEDIIRLLTSLPHTNLLNDIKLLERLRSTAKMVDKTTLPPEQLENIRTNLIVSGTNSDILSIVKNAIYKSSILKLISILDKPSSGIRRRRKTYIEMYEQIWKYFNYNDSLSVLKGLLDTDKSLQPVTSETTESWTSRMSSVFKRKPNPATVAPTAVVAAQPSFSSQFNDSQLREILGWNSHTKNSLLDTLFSVFSDNCFEFNNANSRFLISQTESNDEKLRYCFMLNWIILLAFNAYVKHDNTSITITIVGELIFNIHKSFLGWLISEKSIFQLLFTPENPILQKSKPDYSSRIKANIISDIRTDVTLDPLKSSIHRILCNLDHHKYRPPPPPIAQLPSQRRPPLIRLPQSSRPVSRPASPSLSAEPSASPTAVRTIHQPSKGNAEVFSRRVRPSSAKLPSDKSRSADVGGKRTRKHKKHSGPTRRRNTKPHSEIGHKYTRKHTRT
jgi:hypothetical protein